MNHKMINELSNLYGTPNYLYDLSKVEYRLNVLKDCLGDKVTIFYSIKANPNRDLIKFLDNNNTCFEVSSQGELEILCDIGIDSKKIVFSGPGKQEKEIEFAISKGVFCIDAESLEELKLINKISKQKNKVTAVAVRINPDLNTSSTGIKMTGVASQFGIEFFDIPLVLNYINTVANLSFAGIHVYYGTQILGAHDISKNVSNIFDICKVILEKYNLQIKYINFGGGFGVPYFKNENELEIDILKAQLKKIFVDKGNCFEKSIFAFESGRFLVSESGYYVIRVLYCKKSKDKTYLICDGGSNFHANSAFLGRVVRRNYPIEIIKFDGSNNYSDCEIYTITGPLCTPTDVIAQDVLLPKCQAGDLIVVKKSGAYGITNSPVLFISHEFPKEIIIKKNGESFISNSIKENLKIVLKSEL